MNSCFDIMKVSGIWVLYFVVGTPLMYLNFSCGGTTGLSVTERAAGGMTMEEISRKLEENGYNSNGGSGGGNHVNLEDYRPIDPVPSSKACIRPGPIEHGTPLNPYIPKPPPPPSPV